MVIVSDLTNEYLRSQIPVSKKTGGPKNHHLRRIDNLLVKYKFEQETLQKLLDQINLYKDGKQIPNED